MSQNEFRPGDDVEAKVIPLDPKRQSRRGEPRVGTTLPKPRGASKGPKFGSGRPSRRVGVVLAYVFQAVALILVLMFLWKSWG